MKITVVTPVRNEEKYISITMDCMCKQTVLPVIWVIINDGSSDGTERIIYDYMKKFNFIRYVYLPDRGYRKPAYGVIEAFYRGLKELGNEDFDVLSKFDADLEFPNDTLEKVIQAFRDNPQLGITGGTRYEKRNNRGEYRKVIVPKGFVGGPFKFYRKKCFHDIGALVNGPGWDGVDTIKANMKGWETYELESLKIIHLKSTGSAKGEGIKKAYEKDGYINYYMGGYLWYFALRIIRISLRMRNPMIGYYMIRGYLQPKQNNKPRESKEFRKYLKKIQITNTINWTKHFIKRS